MRRPLLTLQARFSLRGLNLEKVLNAARKENVTLRSVRRMPDRSVRCVCLRADTEKLSVLCGRFSCQMLPLPAPGLTRLLESLKKHKFFTLGAVLFLVLVALSMRYVWGIEIADAGAYAGDIRAYLAEQSIRPGILRSGVNLSALRDALEWRFPKVAWVRVEYRGVFLRITLVEGVPPPEVETSGRSGDVVASQDALVESVVTLAGTVKVKPGDFVRKGQVLIEGVERAGAEESRSVKARGEVIGRAWIENRVSGGASQVQSVPTGNSARRRILVTPWIALTRSEAPVYPAADKSVSYRVLGGAWLPIYLLRENYEEVTLEKQPRDDASVKSELARAALLYLTEKVRPGDVVVDKWVDYSMIDVDTWTACAVAEVRRDIGRFVQTGSGTDAEKVP